MSAKPTTPNVAVLLSTYNGEAYLEAQLDSLAVQEGVTVEIFARDDGSSDRTREILTRHARTPLHLEAPDGGTGLGPVGSFLQLLATAPDSFDYYAFCDQDDVWLPDKLARAVRVLAGAPTAEPRLYCSRVQCVDEALRPLGPLPANRDSRFEHLLFENIAYGNTVVMNAQARSLVCSAAPGTAAIMHDWWCALVVSALGTVIHDDEARILYRQHRGNVIGASIGRIDEVSRHLLKLIGDPRSFYPIHDQAEALLRSFGDRLAPDRRSLVQTLVSSRRSLAARLRYATSGVLIRNRPIDAIAARVLVAAGLY
jgi:glycosyltransferase involved in cell wall biosynthesis